MSQIVHVVSPDGTRFERTFGDAATGDEIVAALHRPDVARLFGRAGFVMKKDAAFGDDAPVVPHADAESPWVVDHPDTVICVGVAGPGGEFRETKRLAGPPAAKPAAKGGGADAGEKPKP